MNGWHCRKTFGILFLVVLSLEGAVAQQADLPDQVLQLQAELIQLKAEKDQALEACALHKEEAQAAEAQEAALRARLVEEEQRVDFLASALRDLQQQARALGEEARGEFLELESQLSQRTFALQEARARITALQDQVRLYESEREPTSAQSRQEQDGLRAALQAERERVEGALEKIQSHEKELQAQLQEQQQAYEVALQASMDEVAALRAELAERDAERDALLVQLSESAIMLALQEMADLEREMIRMQQQRVREQESLGSRILVLEQALADMTAERDALQAQDTSAP